MKALLITIPLSLLTSLAFHGQAQSTTGGRSGGSTASTGAGYESEGKRPATSNAASMTIADEGASRAYMYVPPTPKNRSASPDGSGASKARQPAAKSTNKAGKKTNN